MTSPKKPARMVITGGTVVGEYNMDDGIMMPDDEFMFERFVKKCVNAPFEFSFDDPVCIVDCSEITDEHRDEMVDRCQLFKGWHVMVPHGTRTIRESAQYVANFLVRDDLTVVFFGSRGPAWGVSDSDGAIELGCALIALQQAGPGVFISTQEGWEKIEPAIVASPDANSAADEVPAHGQH